MKEREDFTERRQHERACVQNLVVGILNSGEPITIGSITDISLGGVRCTDLPPSFMPRLERVLSSFRYF